MKKTALAPLLFLALSAVMLTAIAAGANASDPLISLSYLNTTYTSQVDTRVDERLDASDAALLAGARQSLELALSASGLSTDGAAVASTWQETRLKEGDVLSGGTGLNVLVLAGSVRVSFSAGTVVDVTTGSSVQSGSALTANHRYMVAEDTLAQFTVTSKTAVVSYQGVYAFTLSGAVDYNAIASALKTMHLFKGTFTGYGSGYDLEVAPTRLQALIMFIRVLGEEDAALASNERTPFTDIAPGTNAAKYVGYAYAKGYTNGYTATTFRPSQGVNAYQYTEFILRALGYSSASNTDLSDTLDRALYSGVINAVELSMLQSAKFLRAELVYLSYYALDAAVAASGESLRDTLIAKGVFTAAESAAGAALIPTLRLR